MKLGKLAHKYDSRTVMLAEFLADDIRVPAHFDFDTGKAPFGSFPWGNRVWRNCVVVAEAHQLLRNVRITQRRTLKVTASTCIMRYKRLSGARFPGDQQDTGLAVLDAMKNWHSQGFHISNMDFKIDAYGELDPQDGNQLRNASYALNGIHLGFWLPRSVRQMNEIWDFQGESGSLWKPGSYGGHLAYSKSFTPDGHEILSNGKPIFVTNRFIAHYCDEAWAVVDDFTSLRIEQVLDTQSLFQKLVHVRV